MNLEDISNVSINTVFGTTNFIVTLNNGTILFVPDDNQNTDWWVVQEWLAAHP